MALVSLRVKGGATIPVGSAPVWFFGGPIWCWLEADESGVTVGDSWGFLTSFGLDWKVTWGDLEVVEIAGRSVRFVPHKGRSCRFFSFSAKRIRAITEAVELHGLPTPQVFTTLQPFSWLRRRAARPQAT